VKKEPLSQWSNISIIIFRNTHSTCEIILGIERQVVQKKKFETQIFLILEIDNVTQQIVRRYL
jgi:hypothetical protein